MHGGSVLALTLAVQSASPVVSDLAEASAAWERAEDARRACCSQKDRCSEPIAEVERCYIEHADQVFADYRRAFDRSNATDLDALRRCDELATRIVEQWTEQVGHAVCTHEGEVPRACAARYAAQGCDRNAIGLTGPAWWEPLLHGANLADAGHYAEAKLRFARAYELYLTSTGASGQFLEAWFILREATRATLSACGVACAPGELRLGEVLAEMARLFERFHQGCHASSPPEVRRVCEERNFFRAEQALTLVRVDGLYREAAGHLEAAYGDCAAMVGERDERRSERVLSCWRAYGRRAVWLRSSDAAGSGRAPASQEVHRAKTLVGDFVRDMQRDCDSGTRQAEVADACAFLGAAGGPAAPGRADSRDALSLPMRTDATSSGLSPAVTDPARLIESPLYDALLNQTSITAQTAQAQIRGVERGLASQQTQQAAAGIDCTHITSPEATRMCSAARLLHRTQKVVIPMAVPAPMFSVRPPARPPPDSPVQERSCRSCRPAGIATLGVGAAGLVTAGLAAVGGIRNERAQQMLVAANPGWSAEERREAKPFRDGEAMNRLMVAGFVIGGAGIVAGAAILIVDAVQRGHVPTRVRAGSGGLVVAF